MPAPTGLQQMAEQILRTMTVARAELTEMHEVNLAMPAAGANNEELARVQFKRLLMESRSAALKTLLAEGMADAVIAAEFEERAQWEAVEKGSERAQTLAESQVLDAEPARRRGPDLPEEIAAVQAQIESSIDLAPPQRPRAILPVEALPEVPESRRSADPLEALSTGLTDPLVGTSQESSSVEPITVLLGESDILPGLSLPSPDPSTLEGLEEDRLAELLALGERLMADEDLEGAVQAYSEILGQLPRQLEACLGRGRCHVGLGDYSAAEADFQRAEELDPQNPEPLAAMGNLFFARKDYAHAIERFNAAIELDGTHAMARCRRGISHYYQRNYREAFGDLQRAYNLDPEIPNIRKFVQMAIRKLDQSGGK